MSRAARGLGAFLVMAAGLTTAGLTTGGLNTAGTGPAPAVRPFSYVFGPASPDQPYTAAQCQAEFAITCYTPQQIRQAYGMPALFSKRITGKGKTIVLIDVYGSPTISDDLRVFDRYLGGPAASLRVIQPVGFVPPYDPTMPGMVSWASETTLDVEYAHVMAPGAKLILLELGTDIGPLFIGQLADAIEYVVSHHLGDVISQSFGEAEQTLASSAAGLATLSAAYADAAAHHITVLAATGDSGSTSQTGYQNDYYTSAAVNYPATDPMVTAVGGTALHLDDSGNRTSPDTVWNDTYNPAANQLFYGSEGPAPLAAGGGQSAFFARPSYQARDAKVTGSARGVPDVSMSASCASAVNVYEGFRTQTQTQGWYPACGTSEAAPEMAGVVALADQLARHDLGFINPALYELAAERAAGITRVTSGQNGTEFIQDGQTHRVRGYRARNGYSLAAGVGTIDPRFFVPELARLG